MPAKKRGGGGRERHVRRRGRGDRNGVTGFFVVIILMFYFCTFSFFLIFFICYLCGRGTHTFVSAPLFFVFFIFFFFFRRPPVLAAGGRVGAVELRLPHTEVEQLYPPDPARPTRMVSTVLCCLFYVKRCDNSPFSRLYAARCMYSSRVIFIRVMAAAAPAPTHSREATVWEAGGREDSEDERGAAWVDGRGD